MASSGKPIANWPKLYLNQINSEFSDYETLTSELISKIRPEHCYAFITDSVNENHLNGRFFTLLKLFPWYVVTVRDSEDLFSPNYATVNALKQIRANKCDVYVVLLQNGIQAERLLRFGDEHRLIDTRAKFVLNFDYRLFSESMLYLWRRIINVVFIRELKDTRKTGGYSSFELSTVPFPQPLQSVFVERAVDVWRKGRFKYGRNLYYDKTANLQGEELKAVVIEHTPAVIKANPKENAYSGMEAEILDAISQAMNFTYELFEPLNAKKEKWGKLQANGTMTGLLGEMVEGNTDFALGDLHYTQYHLDILDLSIPYYTECLTFITPEFVTDNSWKTLILPFSPDMWTGVGVSLLCVGMIFFIFSKLYSYAIKDAGRDHSIHKKVTVSLVDDVLGEKVKHSYPMKERAREWLKIVRERGGKVDVEQAKEKLDNFSWKGTINKLLKKQEKPDVKVEEKNIGKETMIFPVRKPKSAPKKPKDVFESFSNCIFLTYSMLLVVSLPKLPETWSVRVLTGWYYIYCILVVVAYRASMTAILANPIPKVTIDTLEQLAESTITCGVWSEETQKFFTTSLDETTLAVGERVEIADDEDGAIAKVLEGSYAYYENTHFLKDLRSDRESDQETLHIMRDCIIKMPISLGIQKNSPLKPTVDKYLRRLIESGLVQKWLSDATEESARNDKSEMPPDAVFNLPKLLGGFVFLGCGYLVGLIALIGELFYFKCIVARRPGFDKYSVF